MAIIREKKNFKIGTIGVARASEASKITGQAISQSANKIGDMLFEKAAADAQKAGIKAGASVDPQEIITINPQTGEPEAYAPPVGMGTIGADAYQRVVMKRFQQSMEDEIRNKGKQLAAKYQGSSNGAALYETAMSDYIASMTNVAGNEFKGFIADVGTSYLNATKTNMAIAQIKRERSAARSGHFSSIASKLQNIEEIYSQFGSTAEMPETKEEETYTNGTSASAKLRMATSTLVSDIDDGSKSKILSSSDLQKISRNSILARARGIVRFHSKRNDVTSEEIDLLKGAISTANPNAVPAAFADVASVINGMSGDFAAQDDLEKFAQDQLSDRSAALKIIEANEIESQQDEEQKQLNFLVQTQDARAFVAGSVARDYQSNTIQVLASNEWDEFERKAFDLSNQGKTELSKQTIKQQKANLEARASVLRARAFSGLSSDQASKFLYAISQRRVDLAPESAQPAFKALLQIEAKTGQTSVIDTLEAETRTYRRGGANFVDSINEEKANREIEQLDILGLGTSRNVEEDLTSLQADIANIKTSNEKKKALNQSASKMTGINYINTFFANQNLNERQLNEAATLFDGGTVEAITLSKEQVEIIKRARSYALESGSLGNVRPSLVSLTAAVKKQILFREEDRRVRNLTQQINVGIAPDTKEVRKIMDEQVSEYFFNGQEISGIWQTTESTQNPTIVNALTQIMSSNYIPQSLHNTFLSAGEGNFTGDINAVVSHWKNIRTRRVDGIEIESIAARRFREGDSTKEAAAMLDYLSDLTDFTGNIEEGPLIESYKRKRAFDELSGIEKKATIKASLDDQDIDDFVLSFESLKDAPSSAKNSIKSLTLSLIAQGEKFSRIRNRIEDQIDITYPSGDGKVRNSNGGDRTKLSLNYASAGYEGEFENFIANKVAESTDIKSFTFGEQKLVVREDGVGQGVLPTDESIYLEPIGENSQTGEVQYIVKRVRLLEEGGDEIVNTMVGGFLEGETVTRMAPLIISNRDPEFIDIIKGIQSLKKEQAKEEGMREQEKFGDKTAVTPLPTVESVTKGTVLEGFDTVDFIRNIPFIKEAIKGTALEGDNE